MNLTRTPAGLAMSLVGGVRSVGLVSQSDLALKHFSNRVLACVRSMDDGVVVDEYSGLEFLNLISRLNQEVAPYLQQQAQPPGPAGPMHVWVIDQADKLTTEQQSIIFRLIELFPALPFRVIWLSSQPLQAWKEHAKTECVFLDLDAIDPEPVAAADINIRTEESRHGTASRHQLKIVAGLLTASLIGVWAWRSALAPEVPSQAAQAISAAGQASDTAATVSEASAAAAPQLMASKAPSSPVIKSTSASHTSLPEVARTGARWLKGLPADTLVVEHGTFHNLAQAQKLQAQHKELGTARIIAVREAPNAVEWQYSVVTGPFRSEERARTYVSRLDWRASTRIRGTDPLKPLLVSDL